MCVCVYTPTKLGSAHTGEIPYSPAAFTIRYHQACPRLFSFCVRCARARRVYIPHRDIAPSAIHRFPFRRESCLDESWFCLPRDRFSRVITTFSRCIQLSLAVEENIYIERENLYPRREFCNKSSPCRAINKLTVRNENRLIISSCSFCRT